MYESEIAKTNYKNRGGICLLALNIELINGTLTGKYRPITNTTNCLAGTVKLNFSETITDKEENNRNEEKKARISADVIGQEPELKAASPDKRTITVLDKKHSIPEAFSTRNFLLVKELIIDADKAEIAIYDNGVIDGDSITLADNGTLIFKKAGLSTNALRYTFDNTQTETHEIAFYADNLGGIPPNTGLMVVIANRKRWEINFSSDLSNTAFVKIILNKKH